MYEGGWTWEFGPLESLTDDAGISNDENNNHYYDDTKKWHEFLPKQILVHLCRESKIVK